MNKRNHASCNSYPSNRNTKITTLIIILLFIFSITNKIIMFNKEHHINSKDVYNIVKDTNTDFPINSN